MRRRSFLLTYGLAGIAGLSGCTANGEPREGVVLTHVELGNGTRSPLLFDVQVLYDGNIVHWAGHEVGVGEDSEMGGRVIEIAPSAEPASVAVNVRVAGKWAGLDFDGYDEYDGDRVVAIVTYGMVDDELRVRPHVSDRSAPPSA